MSLLIPLSFDWKQFAQELQEFNILLKSHQILSERQDIQSFFKSRPYLSMGISLLVNIQPEVYAHEWNLWGKFQSDLVIGSKSKKHYFFVEFEDAKKDSIFKKLSSKSTSEFSPRFEHGYSQIIDWFYLLNDMSKTNQYETAFGLNVITYDGILVIGRSHFINNTYDESRRLFWRMNHVIVNSKKILCCTYDELYQNLQEWVEQMTIQP